jgi:Leucine-rich repeat (LRR) protein
LEKLPETFGSIQVKGLKLNNNQLKTLPESFGNITVGDLDLSNNRLEKLPETFGSIQVKGLKLNNNPLDHIQSVPSCLLSRLKLMDIMKDGYVMHCLHKVRVTLK